MNNKKSTSNRFMVFLLFLSFSGAVGAQKAPGYQGRRFIALYEFNFHPEVTALGNLISNQPISGSHPFLLMSHCFSLEYVLNRRSLLGGSISLFKFADSSPGSESAGSQIPTVYDYNGNATVYSLYIKRFRQRDNAIAPLGRYVKPEISIFMYSGIEYISAGTVTSYNPFGNNTSVPVAKSFQGFSNGPRVTLSYSVGKTFIAFNRIIIDRGIRVSFANILSEVNPFGSTTPSANGSSADPALTDIIRNQLFNVFIGIGLLP
jgi:hypothetical protein